MKKYQLFITLLIIALTAFGPVNALACSPVKVFYVDFTPNSAEVSPDQILKLASWVRGLKERYPNHQAIFVESSVEPEELDHNPLGLGLERGNNVAHVLRDILHFNAEIILPQKSYVVNSGSLQKGSGNSGRAFGVQLDFLPSCPHECPCQLGDPLYKPPLHR